MSDIRVGCKIIYQGNVLYVSRERVYSDNETIALCALSMITGDPVQWLLEQEDLVIQKYKSG